MLNIIKKSASCRPVKTLINHFLPVQHKNRFFSPSSPQQLMDVIAAKRNLHHSHWGLVRFNYGGDVKLGQRASACIWHKKRRLLSDGPRLATHRDPAPISTRYIISTPLFTSRRLLRGTGSFNHQSSGVPPPVGGWLANQTRLRQGGKSCVSSP